MCPLIPGVRVRVTGEVALAHEELQVVSQRAGIAAFLALAMVCFTLTLAFHSWRLMVVTLLTLLVGLSLSAGFATVAVGQLNILSLAFAVLFIGLAVDYAIHLSLRYQELLGLGNEPFPAMRKSLQEVGPALILCAVTTGLGFYTFVPTNYAGMSELGLISGTSMFIGLVVSLTVLPAILLVFPLSKKDYRPPPLSRGVEACLSIPPPSWTGHSVGYGRYFVWLCPLTTSSIIRLESPQFTGSRMSNQFKPWTIFSKTTRERPWTLTLLPPEDKVLDYVSRLGTLESVDKVLTIHDFIPKQQIGKFFLLEELAEGFSPQVSYSSFPPSPTDQNSLIAAMQSFLTILEEYIQKAELKDDGSPAVRLSAEMKNLVGRFDNIDQELQTDLLDRLDKSLLGSIPTGPINIRAAKEKGPITQEDLPRELLERWISKDGTYRMEVYPKKDLRNTVALEEFVNEVRSVAPQVTGLPVIYMDGGNEVAGAFRQAFVSAMLVIVVILAIVLRNFWDVLLVILPLGLAAICLVAYTVIFSLPFNYANVIALPLIFGLGADSGIHIVERMRRRPAQCEAFLRSGTIRGVFFSSLTTMLSFSNLAYTSHVGVASMGQLLTLGVLLTLIGCLVVLPAFLYRGQPSLPESHT